MEPRHLRYFIAVAEMGSLTEAAGLLDHARLALAQVDAAVEAARRAALPARKTFAIGFQPGEEMNWLPWSVVSRPLAGEAPTIDLAVGYSKANTSPILKLFLARLEELRAPWRSTT
jgi:hypothetical protein